MIAINKGEILDFKGNNIAGSEALALRKITIKCPNCQKDKKLKNILNNSRCHNRKPKFLQYKDNVKLSFLMVKKAEIKVNFAEFAMAILLRQSYRLPL